MKYLFRSGVKSLATIGSIVPILFASNVARTQIIPDSTLPVNSQAVDRGSNILIDGGTAKGSNLFHSFQEFSLNAGKTARFNNSLGIQNIFTRVTGNSISQIHGTLQNNGTANLFFLNPNGIIFGANARLNLGGSFLATTAERIRFADGGVFAGSQPLLSNSVPIGLGLGSNPKEIRAVGSGHQLFTSLFSPISRDDNPPGLEVKPGKTLAFIGGNVSISGGLLLAPGGRLEIASVKNGEIAFDVTNSRWSFSYAPGSTLGNVELSQRALLDTSGNGGASVGLYARQFVLKEDSVVLMQNQGSIPDGDLRLEASELIEIGNGALPGTVPGGLFSESVDSGSGARMRLFSPRILVKDGGILASRTFNSAKGGDISIDAPHYLKIVGTSPTSPRGVSNVNALTFGSGAAGDINVSTSNLILSEGGRLSSTTLSEGHGGNVSVRADLVRVVGIEPQTRQRSTLQAGSIGRGEAGDLTINTSQLILKDGGLVNVSTVGSGNGGNLAINAREFVEVSGTVPESSTSTAITAGAFRIEPFLLQIFNLPPLPSGNSGGLEIVTPELRVSRGGLVSARNEGSGDGGTLKIDASRIFINSGGSVSSATVSGDGGNIFLNTSDLRLQDGAAITATAGGMGRGGNIAIATDTLLLDNSRIAANAFQGKGGKIGISTFLLLERDSAITASSELGVDGNVEINQLNSADSLFGTFASPIVLSAETAIASPCSRPQGEFSLSGGSQLPLPPSDLLFAGDGVEPNALVHRSDGSIALAYSPSLALNCQK